MKRHTFFSKADMAATSPKARSGSAAWVPASLLLKPRSTAVLYLAMLTAAAWAMGHYTAGISCHGAAADRALAIAGMSPAYRAAAAANLTAWQDRLFLNTLQLQAAEERLSRKPGQPQGHRRFDAFNPVVTCPQGEPVELFGGDVDGGKLVCPSLLAQPSCVVYSLGSKLNYRFEQDILRRTPCRVVTFDCTVDGASIHPRHTFLKKCLGSAAAAAANPAEWTTLQGVMAALGHHAITFLKIDIEGAEYDVLGAFFSDDKPAMPAMISMELHYDGVYYGTKVFKDPDAQGTLFWPLHGEVSAAEMALFMGHLGQLGYAVVSRDDNRLCPHCSEFTLLRVE